MSRPAIVQEGQVRYYASRETVVLAKTPLGLFKLFRVVFGNDGSIYVPFPYLETKRGLLAEADPAVEADPRTVNLRKNGVEVGFDVKFSHHTSGIVQFSKTGGHDLLPRRQSFRLDGPIGRVFDLSVYWPQGFNRVTKTKAKNELWIQISFPAHPTSLHLWADWHRKRDIVANLVPGATVAGPQSAAVVRATGREVRFLFLGQPATSPLRDHLLLLSAEPTIHAKGADLPTMVFMGGFDPHEGRDPASAKRLAFMYPVGDNPIGSSTPTLGSAATNAM